MFDKFKVDFIQIIKSSSKEEVHKLVGDPHQFVVVVLTIIMLSQTHDTCLDLIAKMNEFEEDAPIKDLLETMVHQYTEITGTNEQATTEHLKTQSPYKKRDQFADPDSYHMFEKLHKLETDLICRQS